MKKYYGKNWEGKRVFSGYKVSSLFELAEKGYFIRKADKEDFYKYKKQGVVYANEEFNFLLHKGKYVIPLYSRDAYALSDWDQYVGRLKEEKRSVLKNGVISR